MKLQKLTYKGMIQMEQDLAKWKEDGKTPQLNIRDYDSQEVDSGIKIEKTQVFSDKMSVGKYFLDVFPSEFQPCLKTWNWLAILYHKQLLTKHETVGDLNRLFINENHSFYPYRHLLKAPYDICRFYKNFYENKDENWLYELDFLLQDPRNISSELYRRITENQDIMKNPEFIKTARKLFYDPKNKKIKTGVTAGIKRLIQIWKQYERSFDMYRMPCSMTLKYLKRHEEFLPFLS